VHSPASTAVQPPRPRSSYVLDSPCRSSAGSVVENEPFEFNAATSGKLGWDAEFFTTRIAVRPLCADTVEKVENRTTPKISPKLIPDVSAAEMICSADPMVGGRFCANRCGPLTSSRAERISGPKKFRSSPKNDFFNTIRQKLPLRISAPRNCALSRGRPFAVCARLRKRPLGQVLRTVLRGLPQPGGSTIWRSVATESRAVADWVHPRGYTRGLHRQTRACRKALFYGAFSKPF
jgi:hypothetical protein